MEGIKLPRNQNQDSFFLSFLKKGRRRSEQSGDKENHYQMSIAHYIYFIENPLNLKRNISPKILLLTDIHMPINLQKNTQSSDHSNNDVTQEKRKKQMK